MSTLRPSLVHAGSQTLLKSLCRVWRSRLGVVLSNLSWRWSPGMCRLDWSERVGKANRMHCAWLRGMVSIVIVGGEGLGKIARKEKGGKILQACSVRSKLCVPACRAGVLSPGVADSLWLTTTCTARSGGHEIDLEKGMHNGLKNMTHS